MGGNYGQSKFGGVPKCRIKDKRGVRDLLVTKHKNRREEEGASGIAVEELTEKEKLIEELCEKEETAAVGTGVQNRGDKELAEDAKRKALERLGETKKRKK